MPHQNAMLTEKNRKKKMQIAHTKKKMKMKAETVRGTQSKFVNATFTNIQKKVVMQTVCNFTL